jgi:hypothetical protein
MGSNISSSSAETTKTHSNIVVNTSKVRKARSTQGINIELIKDSVEVFKWKI